uniref:Uncharacterized protein n=1 Tax=Picea glauca TaxID=3330 RepID=A0A117NHC6_PICGL|nr:hypothetical protein ABT39_MTgene5182 [Picea glauca]
MGRASKTTNHLPHESLVGTALRTLTRNPFIQQPTCITEVPRPINFSFFPPLYTYILTRFSAFTCVLGLAL